MEIGMGLCLCAHRNYDAGLRPLLCQALQYADQNSACAAYYLNRDHGGAVDAHLRPGLFSG